MPETVEAERIKKFLADRSRCGETPIKMRGLNVIVLETQELTLRRLHREEEEGV